MWRTTQCIHRRLTMVRKARKSQQLLHRPVALSNQPKRIGQKKPPRPPMTPTKPPTTPIIVREVVGDVAVHGRHTESHHDSGEQNHAAEHPNVRLEEDMSDAPRNQHLLLDLLADGNAWLLPGF